MISFSQSIKSKLWIIASKFSLLPRAHVSQIGQIGDLKNLTLEQLKKINTSMELKILESTDKFHRVQLDDFLTKYVLVFNSDGNFHHVEEEYWKDLDVMFKN